MGWAFYEMSGGEDFEPASIRMAHLMPVAEQDTPEASTTREEKTIAAEVEAAVVDTNPPQNEDVTRVSLNLASLEDVLSEKVTPTPEPEDVTSTASLAPSDEDFGVPRNVGSLTESGDTPAIIPSLIAPSTQSDQNTLSSLDDIRTVSGNRVNVRGGPSTDFEIVTRLVRGDAVEILEDNGNGWVRMRPVDGGTEGWMADFLLNGG